MIAHLVFETSLSVHTIGIITSNIDASMLQVPTFPVKGENRKEVIQPHVPVRLPCYDLAPVTRFTFGLPTQDFGYPRLPSLDGRCVQDPGTYSWERADLPLLAIPASRSRIADSYLN